MPNKNLETHSAAKKPKVLLELRPALEGFAGIPQETRLLFRGLRMLDFVEVEGLLQAYQRVLAKGTKEKPPTSSVSHLEARKLNRYSKIIISLSQDSEETWIQKILNWMQKKFYLRVLTARAYLGIFRIKLTEFKSRYFQDFIWRSLFSKSLSAADFDLVASANMKVCSAPWRAMHMAGLSTMSLFSNPKYVKINTKTVDIFIAQTPFPARLSENTALVVRYHDAIPVFMPHTIPDRALHQSSHFFALMNNVNSGAYFACVSEATRGEMLRMFPSAASRSVVIHNMVSQSYFPEDSPYSLVPRIIRSRLYSHNDAGKELGIQPKFLTLRERESFYNKHLDQDRLRYLLVVSTIEPRKNHTRLLAAWESLKATVDPHLKLVVVGALGWDNGPVTSGFRSWIDRGDLFMLNRVPSPDLRVLYRHAAATVCPSLAEGFDFAGIESMRSGGVVVASDIAVHREIYDDACEYFNPYSTPSLVQALTKTLYDPNAVTTQDKLRARGNEVSSRYLPEAILPQWDRFLRRVFEEKGTGLSLDIRIPEGAAASDAKRLQPEQIGTGTL